MTRASIPELMSPAGNWDCARAAVDNGADAIYFGLQDGFNARARAANFTLAELPELMTYLRTLGVRGYLTLNTLVFADELPDAERIVRSAFAAGIDALLVQDLGLARLIHELCPDLPLHASTQMTLSSAECIRAVESLGIRRVVLPRELSIEQIATIRRETDVELEAFVHGALCISYSGQCLASLSMGGRSANRGQCAQPCRLPYEVMGTVPMFAGTDGTLVAKMGLSPSEASEKRYPLSPHDLAAYDRLPELVAAGVSAIKIEGRLKSAGYVASVTRHYRSALDDIVTHSRGLTARGEIPDAAALAHTFSRGFCHGWLDGDDHQALVSGNHPAHRGSFVGVVKEVRGQRVVVELAAPIRRGDGVLFEGAEQGGRVYEVFQGKRSIAQEVCEGQVELAFRYGGRDLTRLSPGMQVWKTDDPQAAKRARSDVAQKRRVAVDMIVEACVGRPLRVTATCANGTHCVVETPGPLSQATKHPITHVMLAEQLGRLGHTAYELRHLEARIEAAPMVPLSVIGKIRHEVVRQLDAAAALPPKRTVAKESALVPLRRAGDGGKSLRAAEGVASALQPDTPCLHVLCRSIEQLDAVLACGVSSVILDFGDVESCSDAISRARAARIESWVATTRIHKPGENDAFELLARCQPDGVLVRNLAGLAFFRDRGIPVAADFSLNAVNDLTVQWLLSQGAERVTAAYDLGFDRLIKLADAVDPRRLEVVVHRHVPMFHTEYCLYCANLSQGKNKADCGRSCRRNTLRLRDRLGVEHPVVVDGQCRNTVFHVKAESLSSKSVSQLQRRGIRHFRIELLATQPADEVRPLIGTFRSEHGRRR